MSFGCVGEYDDLDLPQLHSIELDYCALRGDERDEQKALEEKPYNYKNTLIMKSGCSVIGVMTDLPSLTSFKSYRCNFQFVGSVMLESTDSKRFIQISWRGIRIGNECFQWVYSIHSQRNHACVPSSFESRAIEAAIRRRSVCLKQERCVVV